MSLEAPVEVGHTNGENTSTLENEEALLYAARHGELKVVKDLIQAKEDGKLTLNISCKGRNKVNLGWTPLHLATYFGHTETVAELLAGGADGNAVNHAGDTALHKAAFIGREDLVVSLLKAGADVSIANGEGRLARDVCRTGDVHRLLLAAELAEQRAREVQLLTAAKEGHIDIVNRLLTSAQPPSINCVDEQGNTCLHCAAYRGHARVAVTLLQNGVDTSIRNNNGKLASELCCDGRMREVLSVQPARRPQRSAARFEGPLLRRSRFLTHKPVWAVLQRGVLVYYGSRAQAAGDDSRGRRDRKYLDGAKVHAPQTDPCLLQVTFSDGDTHRLVVPRTATATRADMQSARQAWITALNEHVAYSGHYLWAGGGAPGAGGVETGAEAADEPDKPLGTMQDALTNATNTLALLESQLQECDAIVKALEKSATVSTSLHQSAYMRFQHACETGSRSLATLRHVVALVTQSREAEAARLRAEMEKNRVLEQALSALARQHHDLEMSVAEELHSSKRSSRRKKRTRIAESVDSFYDVFEPDSDSDTLVTGGLHSPLGALSPWEDDSPDGTPTGDRTPTGVEAAARSTDSLHTALSAASSLGTLVSEAGHVYRNARSHGVHPPSSQWSL